MISELSFLIKTKGGTTDVLINRQRQRFRFHKMMGTDELRAWYGPDHVALAVDRGAVGTLLISDELFRSTDPVKRRKYVDMVEAVRSKGGEALIFSSMHESGQREFKG